jgi:hypothetical protein
MAGPWKVLAKEEHFYRVELPALIKINLVFSAGSLCRDPNDPRGLRQLTSWPLPANFMASASQLCGPRQPSS